MKHQSGGPGRFWYVIAALIFLLGVGSGLWIIVRTVCGIPNQLLYVMVPGSTAVELPQSGTYTIYHEYRSYLDGQLYETRGSLNGLVCSVSSADGSETIPIVPSSINETYSLGSRAGEAIFKFTIVNPGLYQISAAFSDGRSHPQAILAIGQNILGNLLLAVLAPITILGTCTFLSAIIIIVVLVKRSQANKRSSKDDAYD